MPYVMFLDQFSLLSPTKMSFLHLLECLQLPFRILLPVLLLYLLLGQRCAGGGLLPAAGQRRQTRLIIKHRAQNASRSSLFKWKRQRVHESVCPSNSTRFSVSLSLLCFKSPKTGVQRDRQKESNLTFC